MKPIDQRAVQAQLDRWAGQSVYLHLETTQGVYAARRDKRQPISSSYIRNVPLQYIYGSIKGTGPYRVGLKLAQGWVYCDGLTDWAPDEKDRLLLSGYDTEGRLVAALQISPLPFTSRHS